MEDKARKIIALLEHLAHHNQHHATEIQELAAAARDLGNEEAAALIEALSLIHILITFFLP